MTRAFDPHRPVPVELLEELVDTASRAPSAGKTQGWHLVALAGADTALFWDHTLPVDERAAFAWPGLLDAPLLVLPLADPGAYVERYGEPDKRATGLGAGADAWPVPYWTVDASFAVMTLLLAAEAHRLGALFFGVFRGEAELRAALGIPVDVQLLGAVALGWPASGSEAGPETHTRLGRSAGRRRRRPHEIIRWGGWTTAGS
jgi:nitroreductase